MGRYLCGIHGTASSAGHHVSVFKLGSRTNSPTLPRGPLTKLPQGVGKKKMRAGGRERERAHTHRNKQKKDVR